MLFWDSWKRTQFTSRLTLQVSNRRLTMAETTFMLNTGATIPAVGFGTWQDEYSQDHVRTAIEVGYRHIDTARVWVMARCVALRRIWYGC